MSSESEGRPWWGERPPATVAELINVLADLAALPADQCAVVARDLGSMFKPILAGVRRAAVVAVHARAADAVAAAAAIGAQPSNITKNLSEARNELRAAVRIMLDEGVSAPDKLGSLIDTTQAPQGLAEVVCLMYGARRGTVHAGAAAWHVEYELALANALAGMILARVEVKEEGDETV